MKEGRPSIVLVSCLLLLAGLLLLAALPTTTSAQLPPRATPIPDESKGHHDEITGACIELQVWGAPRGSWAVVQWQRDDGMWIDVDGWCSQLDYTGSVSWWVGPKDFGDGPFRWLVTDGDGGPQLAVSNPFMLPTVVNETQRVELTLR